MPRLDYKLNEEELSMIDEIIKSSKNIRPLFHDEKAGKRPRAGCRAFHHQETWRPYPRRFKRAPRRFIYLLSSMQHPANASYGSNKGAGETTEGRADTGHG